MVLFIFSKFVFVCPAYLMYATLYVSAEIIE